MRSNAAAAPRVTPEVAKANYDRFRQQAQQARAYLQQALERDEAGTKASRQEALLHYQKTLREIQFALQIRPERCLPEKQDEITTTRGVLKKHMELVNERLADLGDKSEPVVQRRIITGSSSAPPRPVQPTQSSVSVDKALKNVNSKFVEELRSIIVSTTDVRLSDIEGNESAKRALEESVILPARNPALFTGLREPCKGILLFGPPGNGKTMLAKALANEAQCTFFNVSAATIMSKWVGEGEKLVQALFQTARDMQPSIIFIDELDSILCERTENENGASRRVKTEFLLQFDGCTTTRDDRVLVLGATNRPQDLDDGVLRRFPRRIFIDLPSAEARANAILRTFERNKTKIQMSSAEIRDIASRTEGYSFSDILALCREAAWMPIRNLRKAELEKASANQIRAVNYADLQAALQQIRPSANPENRRKLHEFARDFAQMS